MVNRSALIFLFLVLLSSTAVYAEDAGSEYIQKFDSFFSVRPSISYNQLALKLYRDDNQDLMDYLPNTSKFAGMDVSVGDFGLGAKFKIPGSEKDEASYGKTTARDIQGYYFTRNFGIDIYYQDYSGFYQSDPITELPLEIRGDMKMTNVGVNAYYVLSDNFSLKAAFKQTEKQKKFAYSFLMGMSLSYNEIKSDRSLVPMDYEASAGEFAGFSGGKYYNLALLPGFGITHLFSPNISGTLVFLMGGGISSTESDTSGGKIKKITGNYKVNGKYGISYNSSHFFLGGSIVLDLSATNVFSSNTIGIGTGLIYMEAYAGLRI